MNFISVFSPTGGNYYEEKNLKKNIIKKSLRKIDTPFHWQFTCNRNFTEYKGESIDIKTGSFLFDKKREKSMEVNVENIFDGDENPVVDLLKEISEEISNRHENFEMIIFYDFTAITLSIESMNVLISYGVY